MSQKKKTRSPEEPRSTSERGDEGNPHKLPEALRSETPSTKLLWLYLRPQGVVSFSVRDMAKALGVSFPVVAEGMRRLEAAKLLRFVGERRPRQRPTFEARDETL